ncbi:MAG TPA: hypothetical protein VE870_05685 [Bacteroidales bacterium]|nr:hypothetical protein [Bacteroidales bacterium]
MKRNFLFAALFGLSLIIGFSSCNKNEISDLHDEVSNLEDSLSQYNDDYYVLLDSIIRIQNSINENYSTDIKAFKMRQIAYLFEAVARQPENYADMVNATEMLYTDINELLPISDEAVKDRGMARGLSFSSLFSALARQPEIYGRMDSIADKFLGEYDPEYISDELLDYTRTYALPGLMDAMMRQPEADSLFNLLSVKYLKHSIR